MDFTVKNSYSRTNIVDNWPARELDNGLFEIWDIWDSFAFYTGRYEEHPDDMNKIKERIQSVGEDKIYINQISIIEGETEKTYEFSPWNKSEQNAKFPISKVTDTKGEMFKRIRSVTFRKHSGKNIVFDASEYCMCYEEQAELISEVFHRMNLSEIDIIDYSREPYDADYEDRFINASDNGSYFHCCGSELLLDEEKVDGRVYSATSSSIDDFWNFEYEFMVETLENIDPNEHVGSYSRKGKDWYFGTAVHESQFDIEWYEGETECVITDDGYSDSDLLYIRYNYKDADRIINEQISVFNSYKFDIEIKGAVENILYDECNDFSVSMRKSFKKCPIVNIIESEYFDTISEFQSDILDIIFSDEIIGTCVLDPYKKMKELGYNSVEQIADYALEIFIDNNLDERGLLFGRFSHLNKVKLLAKKLGMDFRKTDYLGNLRYAFVLGKEEYHVGSSKIFSSNYIALSKSILKKLKLRVKERELLKDIYDDSKFVFVGIEDSLESGNCEFGTKAFCDKHKIDTKRIGGIRGDILLDLEISSFTKRAVLYAIRRKGVTHDGEEKR